jgi:hypothetical protein
MTSTGTISNMRSLRMKTCGLAVAGPIGLGDREPTLFFGFGNGRVKVRINWEAAMSKKRVLVVDGYNVIKVLREFDVSFEDIASLGCHIEGEPETKLRPELIAVWFDEENREREVKAKIVE